MLATLRRVFEDAGWAGPVAVARIRRGLQSQLVYATADAISIHPQGISIPDGVQPLHDVVPTEVSRSMMGSLAVTDKLRLVAQAGWEVGQIITTHGVGGATTDVQTDDQYQAVVESDSLLPAVVSRGIPDADQDSVMAAFTLTSVGLRIRHGDPEVLAAQLRSLWWAIGQPVEYISTYQQLMVSEAVEAMDTMDCEDAEWCIQQALSLSQPQLEGMTV